MTGRILVNPNIAGNVPKPKKSMKSKPSPEVLNVMQKDSAIKVRPQGKRPFSVPRTKTALKLFFLKNVPNRFLMDRVSHPMALESMGIFIFSSPMPARSSKIPNTIDSRFWNFENGRMYPSEDTSAPSKA